MTESLWSGDITPVGQLRIKEIALEWGKMCSMVSLSNEFLRKAELRAITEHIFDTASTTFSVLLGVPVMNLQKDRVIAEWPTTWWQHLRKALGWSYKKNRVLVDEVITFPELIGRFPPDVQPRIYFTEKPENDK